MKMTVNKKKEWSVKRKKMAVKIAGWDEWMVCTVYM